MFKNKLKDLRTQRGLSQEKFAKKIGVSRSAYSLYEIGQREPGFHVLKSIAEFCSISADYLIDDSYTVPVSPPRLSIDEVDLINLYRTTQGSIVMDEKEYQIVQMYRSLSPEERGEVRGLMRGLTLKSQDSTEQKAVP